MRLQIRSLLLVLAILGIASAAFAQDSQDPEDSLDHPIVHESPSRFTETHVWLGESTLNGRSDFWDDNFQNFKASRGKLDGFLLGGDYIKHLDLHNALMFSSSFNWNSINEPARNMLDDSGNPLEHHLDLATLSLTAGYVFYPAGTQAAVIPYLGAGAGLYVGQLRSYRSSFTTDDCDEDGNNCTTEYVDSNTSVFLTFGYFALAGLEVPVSPNMALLAEGRYIEAQANLGGIFKDHGHLDLSGGQYTVGVAVRF
jgi:opacity protein-like surface antigen